MRLRRSIGALAVAGLVALVLCPLTAVHAQEREGSMSLMGGSTRHELSTDQSGYVVVFRFMLPGRAFRLEGSATMLRFTTEQGDGVSLLIPELAVTFGVPLGGLRPYVGAGGGYAGALSGVGSSLGTLFVMGGIDLGIGRGYGLRGEAKYRSMDPFTRKSVDLIVGIRKSTWVF